MKNADSPANPITGVDGRFIDLTDGNPESGYFEQPGVVLSTGLTKREHFVSLVAQSLLPTVYKNEWRHDSSRIDLAIPFIVKVADALLKEVEE